MFASIPKALREHWPEAAIEGASLGLFMISAIGFTILLEHPDSPLRAAMPDATLRRGLMGCAMGATLLALVYNPFGARSGAHFNPVLTFTFWRLGKVEAADGLLYGGAQFAGAVLGVAIAAALLPVAAAHPNVRHAVTVPGELGLATAFLGELVIAFVQMTIVLVASNSRRFHAATGVFAALGVALYITFEAPLSGMSMNPARTLGSAWGEGRYAALWLYFTAPLLGMLLAAELFVRRPAFARVHCAKVHHRATGPCLFRCRFAELVSPEPNRPI